VRVLVTFLKFYFSGISPTAWEQKTKRRCLRFFN